LISFLFFLPVSFSPRNASKCYRFLSFTRFGLNFCSCMLFILLIPLQAWTNILHNYMVVNCETLCMSDIPLCIIASFSIDSKALSTVEFTTTIKRPVFLRSKCCLFLFFSLPIQKNQPIPTYSVSEILHPPLICYGVPFCYSKIVRQKLFFGFKKLFIQMKGKLHLQFIIDILYRVDNLILFGFL